MAITEKSSLQMCVFVLMSAGRSGMVKRMRWLLGSMFYQKDYIKAFNIHSTEEQPSNQMLYLTKLQLSGEDGSSHNWEKGFDFRLKCSTSHHWWWIEFETTEKLDRVFLSQTVIHHLRMFPLVSVCVSTETNSYMQRHFRRSVTSYHTSRVVLIMMRWLLILGRLY